MCLPARYQQLTIVLRSVTGQPTGTCLKTMLTHGRIRRHTHDW